MKKKQLEFSSKILETNKLITSLSRKLPDEVIDFCSVDWDSHTYDGGYYIKVDYFRDETISKYSKVSITASGSNVFVRVEEWTCHLKKNYDMEQTNREVKEFSRDPSNPSYENGVKKAKREAVDYVVKVITSYFKNNAAKFIDSI